MIDLRPFTIASAVAAVGFAIEGAIALAHPVGDNHWDGTAQVLNASFAVAVVALAFVLPYLSRWLRVGRTGRAAVVAAQTGAGLMAVESVASGINGGSTLGGLFFAGLILMTLGLLVMGVSGLRARAVRWAALVPFVAWLVSIAVGDSGGSILLAAALVALAAAVMRGRIPAPKLT